MRASPNGQKAYRPHAVSSGKKPKRLRFFVGLMLVMQLAGVYGIGSLTVNRLIQEFTFLQSFSELTPFNLLSVFAMVLLFQREVWTKSFGLMVAICFLGGFLAELVGVQTGLLFGNYQYGTALGWKLAGVPILIGINWTLLVCSAGSVTEKWFQKTWQKTLAAAAIMVLLDLFIEPVAMRFGFWNWENKVVPLQNYIGWYLVALPLVLAFFKLPIDRENPFLPWVLVGQFFFFVAVNLIWL